MTEPPDGEPGRQPPRDERAERAVLGGMMLARAAIADVVETLAGPADFYRPAHQTVYETILALDGRGEPADPVTVEAELVRTGQLMRVGGGPYLHTLMASPPSPSQAGYYAGIVAERAVLRRLATAGGQIADMAHGATGQGSDVADVGDAARARLDEALGAGRDRSQALLLGGLLPPVFNELDAIQTRGGPTGGVRTGFAELDKITNGLHAGQMIVIAARPAVGKSSLGMDFCRRASVVDGLPAVIFSLEMGRMEIVMRLLSAEAKVALHRMRSGFMGDEEWARLARRMGEIAGAPLYVDDSPNLTMTEIRSKARRLKQSAGLRLVVVDYLQLMTSGRRVESRQLEVAEFSRQLKLLAKELDVPVVAISQLNRGPEQRQDKTPLLADLRESGAIEADADMVLLLHRPDMYDRESPRTGEADLILAKNRNGPTGVVTVAFQGHYSRFVDMAT